MFKTDANIYIFCNVRMREKFAYERRNVAWIFIIIVGASQS